MSEIKVVVDRHLVAQLTDEEYWDLKVKVAQAGIKMKQWVRQAIVEKLNKKEESIG